ncbi:Mitochondrial matrix cochaperone [Trebouxia sp. C0009 RCD-2024]
MLRRGVRQAAVTAKLTLVRQRGALVAAPSLAEALYCPIAANSFACSRSTFAAQQLVGSIQHRAFSSKETTTTPPEVETETPEDAGNSEPEEESAEAALQTTLQEKDAMLSDYKDKLVRLLADMENLRDRTSRQAEQSRSFAIQGFVKSLLDVADNLERAAGSVTDESLQGLSSDGKPLTAQQCNKLLTGLLEGVHLTDRILVQALKQNGVEKFSPLGQKFDPNKHSALFQIPDAEKEPGTVVVVTKSGYSLNGRVVRAAEVGVSTQA